MVLKFLHLFILWLSIVVSFPLFRINIPTCAYGTEYDSLTLTTFNNDRGDISITYPNDWFIKEIKFNNPYTLFISREKIVEKTDMFKVGISFYKFFHQSWYLGFPRNDYKEAVNFMVQGYLEEIKDPNKKFTENWINLSDGTPAFKGEFEYRLENNILVKGYLVAAMKNDVLFYLILESPHLEFEEYRPLFDKMIQTSKFFYVGDITDNELLDNEIVNYLVKETIDEGDKKDFIEMNMVFQDALDMSPNFAKTRFMMGGFFMQVAQKLDEGENKEISIKTAKEYLKSAVDLYAKYPEDYEPLERKLNISQCYYLLGDMSYFFDKNKDEAEEYYLNSLLYFEHPDARRKLNQYFKQGK